MLKMIDKILFLGSGSVKDPGFDGVEIGRMPYHEYMHNLGIKVVDQVIESCHGCRDRMDDYSKQMQDFVEEGNRVVTVLEGGLTFGLPSLQAAGRVGTADRASTQTTFPVVSIPMDKVSYHAFMLPSGHSVIGSVGLSDFRGEDEYENSKDTQKSKALEFAAGVLSLEKDYVVITHDDSEGKLEKALSTEFGIEVRTGKGESGTLSISYGIRIGEVPKDGLLVRANSDANVNDWNYPKKAEKRQHDGRTNPCPTVEVHGATNLAVYAAKILSLQNLELIDRIKKIAMDKLLSYPPKQNLGNLVLRA